MNLNYLLRIAIITCLYSSVQGMDSLPEYALKIIKKCNNRDINTIRRGKEQALPVLHYAIYDDMQNKNSDTQLLQVLTVFLEKGAQPSVCDAIGLTAVHFAISCNTRVDAINIMLNKCEPNIQDKATGDTPLHYTLRTMKDLSCIATDTDDENETNHDISEKAHHNQLAIITKLLERGENPCLLNNDNETVFHLIAGKNRIDIAALILPNRKQVQCLITMLILNKNKNCIVNLIPKRVLLKILSQTLPSTLQYLLPTDHKNISLVKIHEALDQKSKLVKICINEDEKKQWIETGGKTAYEIALENKSNDLAKILNLDIY